MSDTVKNFTKVSMRSRHMPQHRRGHDDDSPCCSRTRLPKGEAGGLVYRDIDAMRRAYSRTHSRDMSSHTRQRRLSDIFHQKAGCGRQVEDPESMVLFAPILKERLADRLCRGELDREPRLSSMYNSWASVG